MKDLGGKCWKWPKRPRANHAQQNLAPASRARERRCTEDTVQSREDPAVHSKAPHGGQGIQARRVIQEPCGGGTRAGVSDLNNPLLADSRSKEGISQEGPRREEGTAGASGGEQSRYQQSNGH